MAFCINVDPNHSYRQAVEIAYNKAKREGDILHKKIEEHCLRVLEEPEPARDVVYHETDLRQIITEHEDGGVSISNTQCWQHYEYIKLESIRNYAERLTERMDAATDDLKEQMVSSGIIPKDVSFVVDETGELKAFSPSETLSLDEITLFSRLANENAKFKSLATDYVWALASFVSRTIEGLDAECARYFAPSS